MLEMSHTKQNQFIANEKAKAARNGASQDNEIQSGENQKQNFAPCVLAESSKNKRAIN